MEEPVTPAPNEQRATKQVSIIELINQPTAAGRDHKSDVTNAIRAALESGDVQQGLELARSLVARHPDDPDARHLLTKCNKLLARPMLNALCGPDDVPRVDWSDAELAHLPLSSGHAHLLSQIDGVLTAEELFDVLGMTAMDFARLLGDLAMFGVIRFERATRSVPSAAPSSRN